MTREEAVNVLGDVRAYLASRANLENEIFAGHTFINICNAIKSLGQEPILDKVRAEIEDLTYYCCEVHPRNVIDDVLEIIDKYKAESEDKE